MSATRKLSAVNTAKYCIFGYILIEELIDDGALTEESVNEGYPEALEIVIQGVQSNMIKMPECEFEEIGAAKYSIFGYILIQELISQGALTDDSVNEAYSEVRSENCGNENSVLEIVIQGMDMFKIPELD
jgi:hypothetical protein